MCNSSGTETHTLDKHDTSYIKRNILCPSSHFDYKCSCRIMICNFPLFSNIFLNQSGMWQRAGNRRVSWWGSSVSLLLVLHKTEGSVLFLMNSVFHNRSVSVGGTRNCVFSPFKLCSLLHGTTGKGQSCALCCQISLNCYRTLTASRLLYIFTINKHSRENRATWVRRGMREKAISKKKIVQHRIRTTQIVHLLFILALNNELSLYI